MDRCAKTSRATITNFENVQAWIRKTLKLWFKKFTGLAQPEM